MSICLPFCMRSCKRKMPKQSLFEIGFMSISSKKKNDTYVGSTSSCTHIGETIVTICGFGAEL